MIDGDKEKIIGKLVIALKKLQKIKNVSELMPEVRINLAYGFKNPKSTDEVAAIPGRITAVKDKIIIPALPDFGASDHMARNLIEFAKYDDKIRAGINIKYSKEFVNWLKDFCPKNGLKISVVDRLKEPKEVQEKDGASIPWKIGEAIRLSNNKIPEVIVEGPAMGKEPLIILTGEDPIKVIDLLKLIQKNWLIYKNNL
ncbi:MAG: thiamine-phosphate synthase family protein [Candidatus Helarchaeota archaeon]